MGHSLPAGANPPPAPLSRRIASLCYEIPLLVAISFVIGWLLLPLTSHLPGAAGRMLLQAMVIVVAGFYFSYCWAHGGQTLPMKTWRLRLVARDGSPIDWKLAARRYVIALPAVVLCGIGFAWALVDRNGDFLHDRMAGTRIVKC